MDVHSQLQWYEARDTLLGCNYARQDVRRAVELAACCPHPEAKWLTELFAGKNIESDSEAREVLLKNEDARSLCFASLLCNPVNDASLRRSADLGFAFAESSIKSPNKTEHFAFAVRAASKGERDGYFQLGCCYDSGHGCTIDKSKAKENFVRAAQLNHIESMEKCGSLFHSTDSERWYWWGLCAATGGDDFLFRKFFPAQVQRFSRDPSLAAAVFSIGRALSWRGSDGRQKIAIFGRPNAPKDYRFAEQSRKDFDLAKIAKEFFILQCLAARQAVDTWSMIGCRLRIIKDVRIMIARLIWQARELANYPRREPKK